MNKINLQNLELKIFTKQNALDYCSINNINHENITELYLNKLEILYINKKSNKMNNIIMLNDLKLKTFTEQDCADYCEINNINLSDITELCLQNNQLTDISGVKIFKNLKILFINENKHLPLSI